MKFMDILINAALTVNIFHNNESDTNSWKLRSKRELGTANLLGDNEYAIAKIEQNDEQQVMDLLRKTYFVDEPLSKAVNLCPDGTGCSEAEEYCRHDLMSGYSLKAIDKNGKIVGVSISGIVPLKESTDGNDFSSQAEKMSNAKFQKILYILANREKEAKVWSHYPHATSALKIKVVATDKDWRRRGIMHRLFNETSVLAKHNSIKLLRVDTSSYYSALGAEKLNFKRVYSILYSDLKRNGEPIIVPEVPHVDDRVYIKELN